MDHYRDGTALYTMAVASCNAGAMLKSNVVLSVVCKMCAALIGTMLSSPEDIHGTAREVRAATHEVEQAKESVRQLLAGVSSQDWEQMARPEMEKAAEKFTLEVAKTGGVYKELAHTLDQLAKMSHTGAVSSVSLSGLLLGLSALGHFLPGSPLAASAAVQAQGAFRRFFSKMLVVYGSAAALAWLASGLMSAFKDTGMSEAVTLTGKDAPAFEQVVIADLPTQRPA
ncbi:hypothetical protein [Nonomuraea sp. NPDC049758]|uniref:hypothetical protein n=1 Tax=Nonomuraea sp. NPDC049758 TaxID=3154360 RepID=UPI00341C1F79